MAMGGYVGWGQGLATVSGRFVNILGEGVRGVTLDDRQVASNSDGTFRVVDLSPGSHQLVVRSPGYKMEYLAFDISPSQDLHLPVVQVWTADYACEGIPHPARKYLPSVAG